MDLNVCVPRRYSRYRRTERVVVMTHAYICVHAIRCTCWRNTGTRYSRYGSSENKLAIYNKSSTTQLTQRSLQSPLPSFFPLSFSLFSRLIFSLCARLIVQLLDSPESKMSCDLSANQFRTSRDSQARSTFVMMQDRLITRGFYSRRMTFLD